MKPVPASVTYESGREVEPAGAGTGEKSGVTAQTGRSLGAAAGNAAKVSCGSPDELFTESVPTQMNELSDDSEVSGTARTPTTTADASVGARRAVGSNRWKRSAVD